MSLDVYFCQEDTPKGKQVTILKSYKNKNERLVFTGEDEVKELFRVVTNFAEYLEIIKRKAEWEKK